MPATGAGVSRFVVDAMLGSLARKLRAFGFDALYSNGERDEDITRMCRSRRRTLLTADRALASVFAKRSLPVLLVEGATDAERISSLAAAARAQGIGLRRGEPRCSLCNGSLRRVSVKEARSQVPPAVARRHRSFYRCSQCGHTYWRGGHWKKLRSLERRFGPRP